MIILFFKKNSSKRKMFPLTRETFLVKFMLLINTIYLNNRLYCFLQFVIYFRALVYRVAYTTHFFINRNFLHIPPISLISIKNNCEISKPINFIDTCTVKEKIKELIFFNKLRSETV